MNERLKELAIQAKIQMVSEPRLQEFADLIIAECIKACENTSIGKPLTTYDRDMGLAPKAYCIQAIQKVFK
jgi:hypothetical protein